MDPILTKAPCQSVGPRSVVSEHIGVKPGYYGGKPNILGHRFKVEHVVVCRGRMGMSPTEIVVRHPTIRLSDVHAALAYDYDCRDEIDSDIAAGDTLSAEIEANDPSRLHEPLRHPQALDAPLGSVRVRCVQEPPRNPCVLVPVFQEVKGRDTWT